ncbi:MAG: head decoration protein [Sphingobium sp.]|nr:MAG: head decoration protein [Sphingobium sp.]
MTTLTETVHAAEHIVSEANGDLSREKITLKSGQKYGAATVLAKFTSGGDTGKYTKLTPAASDGSQTACATLYADVDATSADTPGVAHVRDCEVNGDIIIFPSGISAPNKATAITNLAAVGIIVRS